MFTSILLWSRAEDCELCGLYNRGAPERQLIHADEAIRSTLDARTRPRVRDECKSSHGQKCLRPSGEELLFLLRVLRGKIQVRPQEISGRASASESIGTRDAGWRGQIFLGVGLEFFH